MEEIASLESREDRMSKFWTAQKNITTSVLFWTGQRISKFPMRWAPLSLLNTGHLICVGGSQTGTSVSASVCNQGLKFNLPGFIFGSWRKMMPQSAFLWTPKQSWYLVTIADTNAIKVRQEKLLLAVIFQEPNPLYIESLPFGASMPDEALQECNTG